jgi:hypothetical protein
MGGRATGSYAYFNLSTGQIGQWSAGTGDFITIGMRDYGDGWYRCVTGGLETVDQFSHRITIYVADNDGVLGPWAGDGSTANIYVFGAQAEKSNHHSTYFDTGSGAGEDGGVDRADDVLIYKGDDGNVDGNDGTGGEGVLQCDVHWVYTKGVEPQKEIDAESPEIGHKVWRTITKTIVNMQNNDATSEIRLSGNAEAPADENMDITAHVEKSGGSEGLSFVTLTEGNLEGDQTLKMEWDTDLTRLTTSGVAHTADTDVTKQTDAITHIGIGCQPSTSGS